MNFIGNLISKHLSNAADAVQTAAIAFDPATAGEAEIQTIMDSISADNLKIAELQRDLEAVEAKVAADQKEIDEHSRAVELLAAKPEKQDLANKLLSELETLCLPKLQADQQRLATLKEALDQYTTHKRSLEANLAKARNTIETNKTQLDQAKLELQMANEQRQAAERASGLTKTLSGLNVATDAMSKAAAEMRAKAEAARLDAKTMSNLTPTSGDPDIQAALAEARGQTTSAETIQERLARLRSQSGAS